MLLTCLKGSGGHHVWTVEFAVEAERDLDLIFDHLLETCQAFGDDIGTSFDRAERRLLEIRSSAPGLAKLSFQGTLRRDILEGLRFVRHDKAVFWFLLKEDRLVVQVLAVFFGGQDHTNHMLARLLSDHPE